MKKIILLVAGLILVASGVAAVSAYEAHSVNVKARVENALKIPVPHDIDFGAYDNVTGKAVFPEEWIERYYDIEVSQSFCEQVRMTNIDYTIYAWRKMVGTTEMLWLGDAVYYLIQEVPNPTPPGSAGAYTGVIGDDPGARPAMITVASGNLTKPPDGDNPKDRIWLGLDVPVFEGFWVEATDVETKPSGKSLPTLVIDEFLADNVTPNPRHVPTGIQLGFDLVIQVTNISNP